MGWDDLGSEEPGRRRASRLLAGVDPDTELLDDITHWVSVYTELLDAGWGLMATNQDNAPGVDDHLVQAHLQRLQGRLDFWLQKRARVPCYRIKASLRCDREFTAIYGGAKLTQAYDGP